MPDQTPTQTPTEIPTEIPGDVLAEAWPAGDLLCWDDDTARVHWDFTTDPYSSTPYSDEENTEADDRTARAAAAERPASLREQIATLLAEDPSPERTDALVTLLAELAVGRT